MTGQAKKRKPWTIRGKLNRIIDLLEKIIIDNGKVGSSAVAVRNYKDTDNG